MSAIKLLARCLLVVVMIPLMLQTLLSAAVLYASVHLDPDTLSKAVAECAVRLAFLAFLIWAFSKLGRGRVKVEPVRNKLFQ